MPDTKWKDPKLWTPGELGAFLGGKTVYWEVEDRYDPAWLLQLSRDLKKEGDRVGTAIIIKYLRVLWLIGLPQFRKALIQCLLLVVDAPHHEKIRLFKAYTKAIQRPQSSDGGPARATTATPIYCFLLIYWRAIEKLESVPKLHNLLRKVFGDTVIGDQKRVEKICERIGLSFVNALQAGPVPDVTDKPA